MIQLKDIAARKWVGDFNGQMPPLHEGSYDPNLPYPDQGAHIGDLAIDTSTDPNLVWRCIKNDETDYLWVRIDNVITPEEIKSQYAAKWYFDSSGLGVSPTIDEDTGGVNEGANDGDIAVDVSMNPRYVWICLRQDAGNPLWKRLDSQEAQEIAYDPSYSGLDNISTVQDALDRIYGAAQNMDITIPAGSTRAQAQAIIRAVPKRMNGYEIKFTIEDGIHELDAGLVFKDFVGGYLRIYGNSADSGETKNVILKPSADWDPDNIIPDSDIADLRGLINLYNCDKVSIRYLGLDTEATNVVGTAHVNGISMKNCTGSFIHIYRNTITGLEGESQSYQGILDWGGATVSIMYNYIGGFYYGGMVFHNQTRAEIRYNQAPTIANKINNVRSLWAFDGTVVKFYNNTLSFSTEEYRTYGILYAGNYVKFETQFDF